MRSAAVQGTGQVFPARARFADDQHGLTASAGQRELRYHAPHRQGLRDQARLLIPFSNPASQRGEFRVQGDGCRNRGARRFRHR
jgi:hypothetical protein